MTNEEMIYNAPSEVKDIEVINTYDLEEKAGKLLPRGGFGYIAGGAGDEYTLKQNIDAFNLKRILPRALVQLEL